MTKPTFTNAFLRRRCIVPAEAFYEWVGPKGGKQPLSIERSDGKLLSMAGLFNYWKAKDKKASNSDRAAILQVTAVGGCGLHAVWRCCRADRGVITRVLRLFALPICPPSVSSNLP